MQVRNRQLKKKCAELKQHSRLSSIGMAGLTLGEIWAGRHIWHSSSQKLRELILPFGILQGISVKGN